MDSSKFSDVACKLDSMTIVFDKLSWFAYKWGEALGTECPDELQHLNVCLSMFEKDLDSLRDEAYRVTREG